MTVQDIKDYIEAIYQISGDDEAAHGMEDSLYIDVLKAIAEGAPDAQELAKEALKACDLKFERWCA